MTPEEYEEHLHNLDMEGVAALFDAAHEYHEKGDGQVNRQPMVDSEGFESRPAP